MIEQDKPGIKTSFGTRRDAIDDNANGYYCLWGRHRL